MVVEGGAHPGRLSTARWQEGALVAVLDDGNRAPVDGGGRWQVLKLMEEYREMIRGEIGQEDDRRWYSLRERIRCGRGSNFITPIGGFHRKDGQAAVPVLGGDGGSVCPGWCCAVEGKTKKGVHGRFSAE
jgi:hypothetical protein